MKALQIIESEAGAIDDDIPAITLCAQANVTGSGWKNRIVHPQRRLLYLICGHKRSFEDFEKCLELETYNQSDMILDSNLYFLNNNSRIQKYVPWMSEFTYTFFGRCLSLNETLKITYKEILKFYLQRPTSYSLYIHDPKFFMITVIPNTIPRTLKYISTKNPSFLSFTIQVIRNLKFATKSKPCNGDISYSHTACIKNHISNIVNCR